LNDNSVDTYFWGSQVLYHKRLKLSTAILWAKINENNKNNVSFHEMTKEISDGHTVGWTDSGP